VVCDGSPWPPRRGGHANGQLRVCVPRGRPLAPARGARGPAPVGGGPTGGAARAGRGARARPGRAEGGGGTRGAGGAGLARGGGRGRGVVGRAQTGAATCDARVDAAPPYLAEEGGAWGTSASIGCAMSG